MGKESDILVRRHVAKPARRPDHVQEEGGPPGQRGLGLEQVREVDQAHVAIESDGGPRGGLLALREDRPGRFQEPIGLGLLPLQVQAVAWITLKVGLLGKTFSA